MSHKLLDQIYFNPEHPAGFSSKKKLLAAAQQINPNIKQSDVDRFFSDNIIPSRYSTPRTRTFPRRKFLVGSSDAIWGADLLDMTGYWPRENDGFKWVLIVQDLHSRMCLGLLPMKNKTSDTTSKAFEHLFETFRKHPRKIATDKGTVVHVLSVDVLNACALGGEFFGKTRSLFDNMGIKHYVTSDNQQKIAPTERLILTVKQHLFKILARYNTHRWVDKLRFVQNALNNTVHKAHGLTPLEARLKKNEYTVFRRSIEIPSTEALSHQKRAKFAPGDIVRITMDKGALSKSYTGNTYSQILYQVVKRMSREGVWVYILKDLLSGEPLKGIFYEHEMKKVTGIDLKKLPKNIKYDHARTNDHKTEIYTVLPGETHSKWVPVEQLYYT